MLKRFLFCIFVFGLMSFSCSFSAEQNNNNLVISNGYFSFTMPCETKNTYSVEKNNKDIYICEKFSKKSGQGGFAFGLKIFKNPEEYSDIEDGRKIGELTDKNGVIYDMVLIKPMEISYGEGEKIEENYNRLYDFAENVEIKGVNGNKYVKNQGTKGANLYREIIRKYKTAIGEKWNTEKYKKEKMGYVYAGLSKSEEQLLNKIGYAYYDINSDGIDELFIGEITKDDSKSVIFDVYTMVNRRPEHVASGNMKDKLFICNDKFLWSETLSDSGKNSIKVFELGRNSVKMTPYVTFIYDKTLNKKKPWFVSYGIYGNLENVSKNTFKERKNLFSDYKKLELVPLGKFN